MKVKVKKLTEKEKRSIEYTAFMRYRTRASSCFFDTKNIPHVEKPCNTMSDWWIRDCERYPSKRILEEPIIVKMEANKPVTVKIYKNDGGVR